MRKNQKPKSQASELHQKLKEGKEHRKKTQFIIYGLAFLAILLGILYVQFSYVESNSNKKQQQTPQKQQEQQQQQQKQKQKEEVKVEASSVDYEQTLFNNTQNANKEEQEICEYIFIEKREIDAKQLLKQVKGFIDQQVKQENEKKDKLRLQLQYLSQRNLSPQEVKMIFQKREIQQMKQEVSDSQEAENAEDTDSEENLKKQQGKGQQEVKNQSTSQKQKNTQSSRQRPNEKPTLDRLFKRNIQQLECFLYFYDEFEYLLQFEMIKQCEFVENEFIQLKWKGKTSLFDLVAYFYEILQMASNNKINWKKGSQQSHEVISTIYYYSKVILSDLYDALRQVPELFQYVDPEIEEYQELQSFLPMKQIVKNLVDVWENNWVEMGIHYPSHLSIKKKEERIKQFQEMMQNNTVSSSSNSRLKWQNNKNIQAENQEKQENQKQNIPSQAKSQSTSQKDSKNNTSNSNKNNQQIEIELAQLYDDEQSKKQENIKKPKIIKDDIYIRLDDKELSYEDLGSEDLEEIVSLEEQIKILWKCKEWKQNFKGLQYNNFFLASRRSSKH